MKNITLFKNEKCLKILTTVFNQLHLIIITIVLILFSVETANAQCVAPGNQTSYGSGSWIGYVYASVDGANPPSNVFTSTYRGYITQTETFDQNVGSGSISGTNLCGTYSNQFSIRYKMEKTFPAGYYTFTVGGDDGYRLSIDGGSTFLINNFADHSYTTTTSAQVYLSGLKSLVLEYYEQGGDSRISFSYNGCTDYSTAATSITGNTSICSGTSTTLTATGGTLASGASHQWGTGSTPGSNIISGQTGASITVSPTTNTTYWVRRIDPAPCNTITGTITQTVTVTAGSTNPTSITGNTTLCLGSSTTLTAIGGTLASGSSYEWGTGSTIGSNILIGETAASITVSPTSTTTYWVRRKDFGICAGTTSGISTSVTVTVPGGDQVSYGIGSWLAYVYTYTDSGNPPSNAFETYRGYTSRPMTFDTDLGSGAISDPNLCGSYSDYFGIRLKLQQNFTPGYYTFTVGADDGYRFSLDGGATYIINNWSDRGYATATTATIYLSGTQNLVLEYYEKGGVSRLSFAYTSCTNFSTAPTSISGTNTICNGAGGTTLSASGGYAAPGVTYQWGTGNTVGSNIISGATSATYYVNPTTTTTYWVRRVDGAPCNLTTTGVTQTVTVSTPSTAPTGLSATSTNICSGTSITLTASGGTLGTGGSYQWGTGSTVGSNIISGQTAVSMTVTPSSSTVYWVRRIDPAPCNTQTSGQTINIIVATTSTAPTSISGTATLCATSGGTQLTAVGGTLGSNASYQWGTGTTVGSNIISGANQPNYYINPSTTTTYWVRIISTAPCSQTTAAATLAVTVKQASTQPTTISGTTTICAGQNTTLTVSGGTHGTGAVYEWGTGYSAGTGSISGATSNTITVNPTISTGYWVRRVDPSPCPATNSGWITTTVNVNGVSTAPTSITPSTASPCPGVAITLTASGGTAQSGSSYQWGTGSTIGSNILSGQTNASLSITPSITTTYWVRRYDPGCSSYTAGITYTVTLSTPGNPAVFGSNAWNVYGYSGSDITLATTTYVGYYTDNVLNFNTQSGPNGWTNSNSPSGAAGWNGCLVPHDNHTFTAKRQGFPCGRYTVAMQNWDDVAQLYINGTMVWSANTWSGTGNFNIIVGTYDLDSSSTVELRNREITGVSNISITFTNVTVASTAPTAIAGTTAICNGSSTTLTASGGTTGTNGIFQWGTGLTVGSNIITGQTSASITVSPTNDTTYWVRRVDSFCGTTTTGVTQAVTVSTGSVAGTLNTTATTICRNTKPNAIILSGNVGNVVKWQYANDAAFTSGVTNIANTNTTLSSAQMGNLSSTRYYRAVVQNGSCPAQNTAALGIVIPPSITYSNGSWNGTPDATSSVVISSNLTLNSNLTVCSCQVTAGVTLTVNSGNSLVVQTSVTVDNTANIIIKDKASLVQVDDSATNIGSISVFRKSAPMKLYDFTYWSSPVQNWRLNQLSPNTLSDKYFSFNPITNNWVTETNGTAVMASGKGYIVRAPQGGWSTSNATGGVYEGNFIGVPNTGVIPVSIQKGAGYMNLIGNPYPSAIDIDLFLTDPSNAGIVNGTVYLWTHNTAISSTIPGNNIYNYTSDDYAKYNLTGGIKTASSAITGGIAPDGKIASGQGFFIEANSALAAGTYTANFKNSMRLVGNNNQFYRLNNNSPEPAHRVTAVEKHRVWISMSNAQGAYNETLVGYVTGASNGYDYLYDGNTLPAGNVLSLYSVGNSHTYSIQGRALPFVNSDIVPLGYQTSVAGNFTIAIEDFDGLFQNQDVYLVDKLSNATQNLKNGAYSFTTATGTFNDRFELRFINSSLGNEQNTFNENSVIVYTQNHQVNVHSAVAIEELQLYDMLGRNLLTQKNLQTLDFKSKAFHTTEALIVKVKLSNQSVVTRKIVVE